MTIEIEPTSIAGILLREHDNAEEAAAYALHVAQRNRVSNPSMAQDYVAAAQAIERAAGIELRKERERS